MQKGRLPGAVSELTKVTREVFSEAFIHLGGAKGLIKWAKGLEGTCTTAKNGDNMSMFYTLFAKTLPKEIKTEDLNRTHEQFIELMKEDKEHKQLTAGKPLELVEVSPEKGENKLNVT
jgi:hypothetical protein